MFSAEGLPAGSDTLEYAWLIDVQAGALTGRVSVPQVTHFDTTKEMHDFCVGIFLGMCRTMTSHEDFDASLIVF